ncbi:hypothetical protein GCM10010191_89230 [Actinomadura vinacea]|uniref:ATP/GTP-binding protein n=1 Tax=Actinomadura vinacea TaxID=115336 RepID=A0ABP5XHV3_9ACTN
MPIVATNTLILFTGTFLTPTVSIADHLPPIGNKNGYGFGVRQEVGSAAPRGAASSATESAVYIPTEVTSTATCQPGVLWAAIRICRPNRPLDAKAGRSPAEVALSEWRRLPIPEPEVRTAPPRGSSGLVGLPHWFWVANWRPLSERAQAGGAWVEITARPQSLTVDPGGGQQSVRCPGAGTAYDASRPAASQRTDCSYTFSRSSLHQGDNAYRVRVTVTWGGTWVGSGGAGGVLPPLSRSTSFPVRVAEAQGLYR